MTTKLQTQKRWMWLLLVVIVSSCQTTTPIVTLSPEQKKQVSLLVSLDAPVFIKRDGWKDFEPIGFGTIVYPTDLLNTKGQIFLLCGDMQTIQPFTSHGRNPCPLPGEGFALKYDGMLFSPGLRGTPTSGIPTLISPRNTTILDKHPLLRWQNTGAATYTVEIHQGSEIVWSKKDVTGSEIVYPADARVLESGQDYMLVVTDNITGHSSAEDKEKGLGFQVVSDTERGEIESQQHVIRSLPEMDEPARKFALAMYYINLDVGGRGLWYDACILLEEVAKTKPREPIVFLRLADVLAKMALWDEAESAYQNALTQAKNSGDLETQADALAALWRINPTNQAQFDQAVSIYEQIGAKDKANALKEEE
jgi:hypothetical protein